MPTYRITDPKTGKTKRITGDSPPTEQELNDIFASEQTQSKRTVMDPADVVPTVEKVGALGQAFVEPSAAGTRNLLRSKSITNKLIGSLPMGIGASVAGTGVLGKGAQAEVTRGAVEPSQSETFQSEAVRKEHKNIAERAGNRTGMFAPDKPMGKALMTLDIAIGGGRQSAVGMAKDMYTNPIDWLFNAGDIASAGKTLKTASGIAKESGTVKKVANLYRRATGRGAGTIRRGADISNDNKKIVVGLEAVADNLSGKKIETAEDGLEAVMDTKKSVRSEYDALRKSAQGGGATVDLNNVGNAIINSKAGKASRLVNADLQTFAFEKGYALKGEGKISLDDAEEMIVELNAMRPKNIGSSIDDVTKAQLNETMASALRKELDTSIMSATGKEYQPLKSLYGSLIELDADFSKSVIKAAKESGNGLVKQLAESIDNVPLIYGILSGNITLAGAAALQKGSKVLINRSKSINNQFKSMFKVIDDIKNPKIGPKLSPITTGRRIIPQEKDNAPN